MVSRGAVASWTEGSDWTTNERDFLARSASYGVLAVGRVGRVGRGE